MLSAHRHGFGAITNVGRSFVAVGWGRSGWRFWFLKGKKALANGGEDGLGVCFFFGACTKGLFAHFLLFLLFGDMWP